MFKKPNLKKLLLGVSLSASFFIYFSALDYFGNKYRKSHPAVQSEMTDSLLDSGWKFHSGDDLQWASSRFNDSAWTTVISDSLPASYNGEISWFRHSVKADGHFFKDPLVISLRQAGASEIFYDGVKVAAFGKISPEKEQEVCMDPSGLPFALRLGDSGTHLIAIRYSQLHGPLVARGSGNYPLGFDLSFVKAEYSKTQQFHAHRILALVLAAGIFLLTLSFVHMLLYLFFRKAKENFFYALFAFCYAMLFILQYIINTSSTPTVISWSHRFFLAMLNPFVFLTLLIFIYKVNRERFNGLGEWIAIVIGLVGLTYAFTQWAGPGFYFTSLVWYAIFCVITMTRGLFKAKKENRPGTKILGAGIGVFALFLFAGISDIFFNRSFDFFQNVPGTGMLIILFFVLMSIPISTSVYLAFSFSNTNKVLEKKLEEVEELSARTIEQEKEKQKILGNQKEMLESQVKERTRELSEQKKLVEEKNKDITDSISYAKRLQEALLPSHELKTKIFPGSFVLYKPKDIVSGDFYFFAEGKSGAAKGKRIIAAVDCTGHGVPGALMSVLGNNLLHGIITEHHITQPSLILEMLDEGVRSSLRHTDGFETRDGMDIALCCFDDESGTMEYAGAQRPLWMVRKKENGIELEEIKANKLSIGGVQSEEKKKFTNHTVKPLKGDCIYIFSDGFADQFGGEEGKKFMTRRFKDLLISLYDRNMEQQETALNDAIEKWKGSAVQVDDILVIGLRY